MTDEVVLKIGLKWLEKLKRDNRMPAINELQAELRKANLPSGRNVIPEAVVQCIKRELLVIRPKRLRLLDRDDGLARQLREKFDLVQVIVIKSVPDATDDELHASLADAVATELTGNGTGRRWCADTDTLGVGSGRAIRELVEALSARPAAFNANTTIMALAGSVFSGKVPNRYWLDSSVHAALLASCFGKDPTLRLIPYSLTAAMKRHATLLHEPMWNKVHPTLAFMGVGILAKDHRFYEEALNEIAENDPPAIRQRKEREREPVLDPIRSDLANLVRTCERVASGGSLVGDISSHFFFIPPPRSVQVPKEQHERILHLIETINDKMLVLQREQFKDLGHIFLIAGSPSKERAIRELLTNSAFPVHSLCTDSSVAQNLLKS